MIIMGCIVLIASCGCLGLWLAYRIRRRPLELRECSMALALLDTEIVWGATPLPEAFSIVKERSDRPWQGFFAELQERLVRGESAGSAWKETMTNQKDKFCLKTEDWLVIADVGKGLGRSDRSEQHKQIELVQRQLLLIKEQAEIWAYKQAKMWTYLGFLGGIAGVLILI
ncbi:Stage III sporulation protein AB (spore_III_AB) [Desulfosporosinus orientis DSM 765]|uniref:Stage III sporulation protein AB (Spore_III_AB) n=1 Tax=Desulfosporosinus orientis (strain ATCC 19365 / DSM 765 / NCIMB 8382 / VKM B-1628 / Singapore I) TaxID=768706 RepID=G7W852_DESOD|nr:stage III sporulation protein AB [Desulfosporosinus orientis]AET66698.1 Stage III sporulation protein AB (spore_III_AB) [Desulfosporosinus orientis DSM 765]